MTNGHNETLGRLETMRNAGQFDTAKSAIDAQSPVLEEMGISADRAREVLNTPVHALESAGTPVPMLEAIVRATNRPPLLVQNGNVIRMIHIILLRWTWKAT